MKASLPLSNVQVEAYETVLFDAMLTADVDKLSTLFHSDLRFNIPGGQTITKQMDLDAYRNNIMVLDSLSVSDSNMVIIEDNAIVTSTVHMVGRFYDHAFDQHYRFIRVWKYVDDRLQLIAGSSGELFQQA